MSGIPKEIKIISFLGLFPFFVGVIATFKLSIIDSSLNLFLMEFSILYSALILSFMGGCLFGFESITEVKINNLRLWASITPALWSLVALLIPSFSASMLAIGFLLVYEFDRKSYLAGMTPEWWLSLRLPLTTMVILSLAVIGFFNEN